MFSYVANVNYCTASSSFVNGTTFRMENAVQPSSTLAKALNEQYTFNCVDGYMSSESLISSCLAYNASQGKWTLPLGFCFGLFLHLFASLHPNFPLYLELRPYSTALPHSTYNYEMHVNAGKMTTQHILQANFSVICLRVII